ncbi:MAG: DrmB family protein, partial [Thermomicrobiales bacterium]
LQLKIDRYRPERTHYVHSNCTAKHPGPAIPVRFMRACSNGHLSDFPWVDYVHKGLTTCPARLRLREHGVTGEAARIVVQCLTCEANRYLGEAFGVDTDPLITKCDGYHPHLGDHDDEPCPKQARTISLGASNAWFGASYSVISLPDGDSELAQLVGKRWDDLRHFSSENSLSDALFLDAMKAFRVYGGQTVWDAIERKRAMEAVPEPGVIELRPPEWDALTATPLPNGIDFAARSERPEPGDADWLERIVLVDRLRLVQSLIGFTRLEAPDDPDSLGDDLIDKAPLRRSPLTWAPATEARGEGIFLQLREETLQIWLKGPGVQAVGARFRRAHNGDLERRGIDPAKRPVPTMRYILLHTLSHVLMREISLECGYAAASLAERIYSAEPEDDYGPMAGILILTSSADSEGTLGGLVRLGKPGYLSWHLKQALAAASDCASDPYCSEHEPSADDV